MTGCMGGLVAQAILEEGEGRGRDALGALRDALEPGILYVELQDHGLPEQPVLNGILAGLASELGAAARRDQRRSLRRARPTPRRTSISRASRPAARSRRRRSATTARARCT